MRPRDFHGEALHCSIDKPASAGFTLRAGGVAKLNDVRCMQNIDCDVNGGIIQWSGVTGWVRFSNITTGTTHAIVSEGGVIGFNGTCTSGIISVGGIGTINDFSAGMVVLDTGILNPAAIDTELTSQHGSGDWGGDPAAIADAVWDEAQDEHVGAGSFGLYLDSEVSTAGGGATVADIWNAVASAYDDDDTMGWMLNNTVKKPVTGDQPIYEGTWMAIELVDVDQIVTEDDLNTWLGGHVRERLGLTDWTGSSKHARQYALNRSLESLRRRNPPLQFSDLVYPQELSDAIKYGAAEHLYQLAMTGEGDVHDAQRKIWEDKFDKEMNGLMVTVSGGDDIPAGSVSAERR
jgi:hypothetical protein